MYKLSILIATMQCRQAQFEKLYFGLADQNNSPELVEILFDPSLEYNIGTKRNRLLKQAKGEYIVYCDDDDLVSPNYIHRILEATETSPDCIGINGIITMNNGPQQQWFISKEYGSWYIDGSIYYRTPNHISPVRRELALLAGFPEISFGEDYAYSMALLPHLKSEVLINEPLYHYIYLTK